MKLQPLQLCRWCAFFRTWKQLLILPSALLIALLLPGMLKALGLGAALLAATLIAAYRLILRAHPLPDGQRPPDSRDALCETVLVDAALIGKGTMLRAAAQPVDPADGLSLRMGSGALLLGSAMTLTADSLREADRLAVYRAVHQLHIVPQRMREHTPILSSRTEESVTTVTVRDGSQERRYVMGPVQAVSPLCPRIWENECRDMTDHDRLRIADTARYIAAGQCRVTAYATALDGEELTFLGLAGLGEDIDPRAVADVKALRTAGLTVMLTADDPEVDVPSLRALLLLDDRHARADIEYSLKPLEDSAGLNIQRCRGDSLLEPIEQLRTAFSTAETALRRTALLMGLAILCALPGGWPVVLASSVVMAFTALVMDVECRIPLPKRWALAVCLLAAALGHGLLAASGNGTALGAMLLAMLAALGAAMRLTGLTTLHAVSARPREWWKLPLVWLMASALTLLALPLAGTSLLAAMVGVFMGAAAMVLLTAG